jgi:hypothetical protein
MRCLDRDTRVTAGAGVYRLQSRISNLGRRNVGSAAVARVASARSGQRRERVTIGFRPIRLAMDLAVPFESERGKNGLELRFETRHAAPAVEIVDAEKPAAALAARVQVAADGSEQ